MSCLLGEQQQGPAWGVVAAEVKRGRDADALSAQRLHSPKRGFFLQSSADLRHLLRSAVPFLPLCFATLIYGKGFMELLENVWLYLAGCGCLELLEQKQVAWFPLISSSLSPLPSSLPAFVRGCGRWGCLADEVSPASAIPPPHRRMKTALSAEPHALPNIFPSPPSFP